MTPAELYELLRDDPKVRALYDAAKPFGPPLGRLALAQVRAIIENLRASRFVEAYKKLYAACDTIEESIAIQEQAAHKKLQAAIAQYEGNEEAKALALKFVFYVALAAI